MGASPHTACQASLLRGVSAGCGVGSRTRLSRNSSRAMKQRCAALLSLPTNAKARACCKGVVYLMPRGVLDYSA